MSTSSASRPLFWSNVLFAVAVLAIVAWCASWFITPRPDWHRDVTVLGILCAAFAGALRRTARRRQAIDRAQQV